MFSNLFHFVSGVGKLKQLIQSDGMFAMRNSENSTSATYLWCKDIEVASPVGAADELAFVFGRNS